MSDPKQKQESEKSTLDRVADKVGGAISGVALFPFKLFDDLFHVSDATSSLKKHICDCSNQTDIPTSQATPYNPQPASPQQPNNPKPLFKKPAHRG